MAHPTIRVTLVDDHKTMLWGLDKLIQGYSPTMTVVSTASNGAEAIATVDTLLPDVILLDLDLDGQCSLDILPRLLANGVSRALIFSASYDSKLFDAAVLQGARGVLRKDADGSIVLKAIEKVHRGELWLDQEMLTRVFKEMMTPVVQKKPSVEEQRHAALTPKERKIIHTVLEGSGAPNKVLAEQLFISEHTLRNNLTTIYQKLGVGNRLELYVYAVKYELGTVPA